MTFNPGDRVRRKNVPAKPTQEDIMRNSTKTVNMGSMEQVDYRETGVILGYNQVTKRYIVKMDGAGNNLSATSEDIELTE